MSYILSQVALQRVIQIGLRYLRNNPEILDEIFAQYLEPELNSDYGQAYIDSMKIWFMKTKLPVLQAWSFNPDRIPAITVSLSSENEDESKAAVNDFLGHDEYGEIGISAFNVTLDIGIHSSKTGDEVLWLYYIVSYILFRFKRLAEKLGLQLHTFSASDYTKEVKYLGDNIWSRWIKFKCTVTNTWESDQFLDIEDIDVDMNFEEANL
jgi:hypothetical protein